MGYSSILLDEHSGTLTSEQRHALDRIQLNSHELLSCVEGIFFLAALEAGEIPVTAWAFDARQIIAGLGARHGAAFTEKGVTLEVREGGTLPIRTDEEKVQKIVDTLVLNALKFTAEGSVTVEASQQLDASVEIRIRDTGIGMRPEEVNEVLEGFQQGDPTARKRFRGIGLGLRLVTRLLESLSGKLDVVSTLGAGTEFVIQLPPHAEEGEQPGSSAPMASEPVAQMKAQASA